MAPDLLPRIALLLSLASLTACGGKEPQVSSNSSAGDLAELDLGPTQTPAEWLQEALDYLELGNTPRAKEALEKAIALDDGLAEAHNYLGRTLMSMSRIEAGHEGAGSVGLSVDKSIQEQGIAELRRAAELDPKDPENFYWLGRALHLTGENAQAVEALSEATRLAPEHGMAHKRLGITHLDAGDPELALASFRRAEGLLPGDPGPAFQIGNLLMEDDPEGARDAFRRAIQADISFAGAYNGLITVLSRLQDPEGSAQAAKDFAKWNNYEARLQGLLGRAQNQPGDIDAQLDVADALLEKRDWEGAREFFGRSIMLDATSDYSHLNLGILNHRLGNNELAMRHLEETIHLKPSAVEPRLQLIPVCVAMGNQQRLDELLALFERDRDKLDAATQLRLAEILRKAGLLAEARPHYETVLAADPGNTLAQAGLRALGNAPADQ